MALCLTHWHQRICYLLGISKFGPHASTSPTPLSLSLPRNVASFILYDIGKRNYTETILNTLSRIEPAASKKPKQSKKKFVDAPDSLSLSLQLPHSQWKTLNLVGPEEKNLTQTGGLRLPLTCSISFFYPFIHQYLDFFSETKIWDICHIFLFGSVRLVIYVSVLLPMRGSVSWGLDKSWRMKVWAGGHIGLIIILAHINFISVVGYSPVSLFAFPDII